jgi:hypothetical protein
MSRRRLQSYHRGLPYLPLLERYDAVHKIDILPFEAGQAIQAHFVEYPHGGTGISRSGCLFVNGSYVLVDGRDNSEIARS